MHKSVCNSSTSYFPFRVLYLHPRHHHEPRAQASSLVPHIHCISRSCQFYPPNILFSPPTVTHLGKPTPSPSLSTGHTSSRLACLSALFILQQPWFSRMQSQSVCFSATNCPLALKCSLNNTTSVSLCTLVLLPWPHFPLPSSLLNSVLESPTQSGSRLDEL